MSFQFITELDERRESESSKSSGSLASFLSLSFYRYNAYASFAQCLRNENFESSSLFFYLEWKYKVQMNFKTWVDERRGYRKLPYKISYICIISFARSIENFDLFQTFELFSLGRSTWNSARNKLFVIANLLDIQVQKFSDLPNE